MAASKDNNRNLSNERFRENEDSWPRDVLMAEYLAISVSGDGQNIPVRDGVKVGHL
jgi:hypothetical protein